MGRSWRALGRSWVHLGASWAASGASGARLGAHFGLPRVSFEGFPGLLWELACKIVKPSKIMYFQWFRLFFEVTGAPKIAPKALLAASWRLLGASWALPKPPGSLLGASWRLLGAWEGFLWASAAGTLLKPSFFRGPRRPKHLRAGLREGNVAPFGPGSLARIPVELNTWPVILIVQY